MTTVTNTLNIPAGQNAWRARVKIQLFASTEVDHSPGRVGGDEILGVAFATVDNDGKWSHDLEANSRLIPRGTAYRVTESHPSMARPTVYYIDVPESGGPYATNDIQTSQPTDAELLTRRESDVAILQTVHGV